MAHSSSSDRWPPRSPRDLQEYQRYTADFLAAVEAAKKSGKNAADAAASINLSGKYPGYTSDRVKGAVDALYAELQ